MTLQAIVYQRLFIIILVTLLFYGIVPLIGAFSVRRMWRHFRSGLMSAALKPPLTYKIVYSSSAEDGVYRFFGSLQAVQDENMIWLSDGSISVSVDLEGVPVYFLPPVVEGDQNGKNYRYQDNSPRKTYWNRVFSLPEGTSFFVAGQLVHRNGRTFFTKTKETPLTVVIYDCEDSEFYSNAVLSGRQRNEYWNAFTPGSLTIGSFTLFIYFYLLIQLPYMRFTAVTALTFSLVPVMPFLPPGLLFYYIYRNYWKRARILRAERDLLLIPVNFFPESMEFTEDNSVTIASGMEYGFLIRDTREEALSIFDNTVERGISLKKNRSDQDRFYIFGLLSGEGKDNMAGTLMIPGNPVALSLYATKKARKYEMISILSFGVGFFMNLLIFLTLLTIIVP